MSDPNPYQPPQTTEPRRPGQVAKRAIGVGAILLLTPVAVAIALTIGCTVASAIPSPSHPLLGIVLQWSSTFLVPFVALSAMMGWASWTHCRQTPAGQRGRRVTILWLTPVAVSVATALGAGLTYLFVESSSVARGGFDSTVVLGGLLAFSVPPLLTLIGMLLAAWKQD